MQREKFGSRIGFLLISAGCAIGIGNVWRFPYVVGQNGGGVFVLIYISFLILVGVPVLTMEFAIGRASQKSAIKAYQVLAKPGSKWHWHGKMALIGNYILMMFYTVVSGWMLYYLYSFTRGKLSGLSAVQVENYFANLLESPNILAFWMIVTIVLGIVICSFGLKKGVERISKIMMSALLVVMVILAIRSITLPGGAEGISFYLKPDFGKMKEIGVLKVIVAAMNQSFFTLSVGIGSMLIFGSYLSKDRSLLGESINIAALDTFVAIVAGLIIFPACFAYNVSPDSGPSLIFITLPNVFNSMPIGSLWGALFFLFMSFASLSTIIAVFENIISSSIDLWNWSRKKACVINGILITIASLPCVLGFNLWSGFTPFGKGTSILDLEDYVVSNILLPVGSLIYLLFCVSRIGWGFDNYRAEANSGKGLKVPKWIRFYVTYVLPILVIVLVVQGILRI